MSQYPLKRNRNEQLTLQLAEKIQAWHRPKMTCSPKQHDPPLTIICISDTHSQTIPLPTGDLLLHSGDLTEKGTFDELQAQLDWLNEQPHEHKVVIAGNHDLLLDATFPSKPEPGKIRADLRWGSIAYLEASSIDLTFSNGRKLKIYGNPFTPAFGNFAFQYPRTRTRKGSEDGDGNASFWAGKIPEDADIVLTHGPPMYHLDANDYGGHVGCDSLLAELYRARPRLVVCGHIHEGAGERVLMFDKVQEGLEEALRGKAGAGTLARMVMGAARPALGEQRGTRLINAAVMRRGFKTEGLGEAVVVRL